jgi:hypothetical protein
MRNGKRGFLQLENVKNFPHITVEKVEASHGVKNGLQISHFAISHVDGVSGELRREKMHKSLIEMWKIVESLSWNTLCSSTKLGKM